MSCTDVEILHVHDIGLIRYCSHNHILALLLLHMRLLLFSHQHLYHQEVSTQLVRYITYASLTTTLQLDVCASFRYKFVVDCFGSR